MDFNAFRNDLAVEAHKLPRDLLLTLQKLATHFGPGLEGDLPAMIENLKPHLAALAMEGAMGYLDKVELEKTVMNVLSEVLSVKAA